MTSPGPRAPREPSTGAPRGSRWAAGALPVALALWGMGVAFGPMLASGLARMEVDPADTRHLNYVLEHDHLWLTGRAELWSPPFFFPERGVAAYTELLLGVAPLYSAWRLFGLAPDTAFQLWMLTVALLNFAAAWLLFRRALGFEPLAAGAGAFLVSFGNARLTELNHQHLLPHFFTFAAVYALARLLRGAGRPRLQVAGLFAALVLQLYAGITLGWFLCFGLGVALAWALAFADTRRALAQRLLPAWPALAASAALSALALWPLLSAYVEAGRALGPRSWAETSWYLPHAQSWLFLGPHNWLYGWMSELSLFTRLPGGGARLGLGLFTTAAVVGAFVRWRDRPWLRVAGLTALTLVLLTTLYRGRVSPWQLVAAAVPGADGIRAVGRIGLLLLLPAGAAVASLVQGVGAPGRRRRWLGALIAALCVAEQGARVPDTYDKAQVRAEVARVAEAIPPGCRAFFYAPVGQPRFDEKTQLDAMWAGLQAGVPTANGYSSHSPNGWELFEHALAPGEAPAGLEARLRRWEARAGLPAGTICLVAR